MKKATTVLTPVTDNVCNHKQIRQFETYNPDIKHLARLPFKDQQQALQNKTCSPKPLHTMSQTLYQGFNSGQLQHDLPIIGETK